MLFAFYGSDIQAKNQKITNPSPLQVFSERSNLPI
jgi:hypothetical protein